MAVVRVHKTANYTVMSNHHFRERNMSLKAKGLLSLMLSLPDDWDYSVNGLATLSKDGYGIEIKKYDIRFVTPNTTYIDDKTMHSMEHLLATSFKMIFKDDMIDLSPMGCKTGFYFIEFANGNDVEKIKEAIKNASKVTIPVPTKENCGSYLLHNIEGARVFLERISNEF